MQKITKIARPHRCPMSTQSDCYELIILAFSPLTVAHDYIFIYFFKHTKYQISNMLKRKCDNNQQDFKIVDLHFVKSNFHSLAVVNGVSETQLQVGEISIRKLGT